MAEPVSFDPPQREPTDILEFSIEQLGTVAGAVARSFEFSCRGDRVPLTLIAPKSGATRATLLVQPAPGDPGDLPGLRGLRSWLGADIALASIELPLFGSRRSPKLSDTLVESIAASAQGEATSETSRILWTEFARQSVMELRRSLDVLAEIGIRRSQDATAFAGAGIGASLGAIACATDQRLRGAVLLGTGGGFGPQETDPARYLPEISPRPLLLVNLKDAVATPGAPLIPKAKSDALHSAALDPVEVEWQKAVETDLLGPAWKFLSPLLLS